GQARVIVEAEGGADLEGTAEVEDRVDLMADAPVEVARGLGVDRCARALLEAHLVPGVVGVREVVVLVADAHLRALGPERPRRPESEADLLRADAVRAEAVESDVVVALRVAEIELAEEAQGETVHAVVTARGPGARGTEPRAHGDAAHA